MNCKKDDLALIVRVYNVQKMLGRPVTVKSFVGSYEFQDGDILHDVWQVEASGDRPLIGNYPTWPLIMIPDHCLRPIGNPGEDAEDESLTWLPSPSRETSPA